MPCDAMGAEKVAESPLRELARERMTSHDPFVKQQQWSGSEREGK